MWQKWCRDLQQRNCYVVWKRLAHIVSIFMTISALFYCFCAKIISNFYFNFANFDEALRWLFHCTIYMYVCVLYLAATQSPVSVDAAIESKRKNSPLKANGKLTKKKQQRIKNLKRKWKWSKWKKIRKLLCQLLTAFWRVSLIAAVAWKIYHTLITFNFRLLAHTYTYAHFR